MRVVYREGEALFLAEADELAIQGNALMVWLRNGKVLQRNFPSEEVLTQFFHDVILPAGDNPIHLENTNIDTRLGQLLDDWDSLYE